MSLALTRTVWRLIVTKIKRTTICTQRINIRHNGSAASESKNARCDRIGCVCVCSSAVSALRSLHKMKRIIYSIFTMSLTWYTHTHTHKKWRAASDFDFCEGRPFLLRMQWSCCCRGYCLRQRATREFIKIIAHYKYEPKERDVGFSITSVCCYFFCFAAPANEWTNERANEWATEKVAFVWARYRRRCCRRRRRCSLAHCVKYFCDSVPSRARPHRIRKYILIAFTPNGEWRMRHLLLLLLPTNWGWGLGTGAGGGRQRGGLKIVHPK